MPKTQSTAWYQLLAIARDLESPFPATSLAEAAALAGTEKSTASQIATAWLSKFVKWGYAEVVKREQGVSGRTVSFYSLTEKGVTCRLVESREVRLDRLIKAVEEFRVSVGTKSQNTKWQALIKVHDSVKDNGS